MRPSEEQIEISVIVSILWDVMRLKSDLLRRLSKDCCTFHDLNGFSSFTEPIWNPSEAGLIAPGSFRWYVQR